MWLAESDWIQLERPKKGDVTDFAIINQPAIEVMQETSWQMLHNLQTHGKERDETFTFMSTLVLNRIFLAHLRWIGLLDKTNQAQKKGEFMLEFPLPTYFQIRITPFGIRIIKTINQHMYAAIPPMLRTIA